MIEKVFRSLDINKKSKLESISVFEKRSKGELIFFEGDEPQWLYYLFSGVVKIFKTTFNNGKDITLNYILPRSFIGEFAVFKNIKYPFSAEMETDGEIIKIKAREFLDILKEDVDLCYQMIIYSTDKLQKNYEYCENLMEKNVRKKIARFIRDHEDLFFKLNKNKIASILNVTPETFSRTLKELKKEGLIIERTVVKINKQKIEEILSD